MKNLNRNFLLTIAFISAISNICFGQEISKRSYEETKCLPRCVCYFTLNNKLPISISYFDGNIFTRGEGTETCSIGLQFSKKQNYNYNKFTVNVYKDFPLEEVLSSSGFEKNKKNKWQFKGNSILLQPKKFTFLKTTKIEKNNELIFIGEAIEDGYISKGPMSLHVYEIVRATPEFYVVAQIIFSPSLPNKTANYLIKDLVESIKSIDKLE